MYRRRDLAPGAISLGSGSEPQKHMQIFKKSKESVSIANPIPEPVMERTESVTAKIPESAAVP